MLELSEIALRLKRIELPPGQILIRQGDVGDSCYLIYDGEVEVIITDLIGQQTTVAILGPTEIIGEIALLHQSARTASVVTRSPIIAYQLQRDQFEHLISMNPEMYNQIHNAINLRLFISFLCSASIFAGLTERDIHHLANVAHSLKVTSGEMVIRENEPGDLFYMVMSGKLEVSKNGKTVTLLEKGDFFGEVALLENVNRTATVKAITECVLLTLSKQSFLAIVEEHPQLHNQFKEILHIRFPGSTRQSLFAPDPLSTIMPSLNRGKGKKYWKILLSGCLLFIVLSVLGIQLQLQMITQIALVVGAFTGPVVYVFYLAETAVLSNRPVILILIFLITAALAIPIAMKMEMMEMARNNGYISPLMIAFIEEICKLIGISWLLFRKKSRFLMDGIVYGAAAGMGFAAFESFIYSVNHNQSATTAITVVAARALLSPFGHGTWTAIAVSGLWRMKTERNILQAFFMPFAAIGFHALWNWQPLSGFFNLVWLLAIGIISILFLRSIIYKGILEEKKSIIALNPEIADYVGQVTYLKCGKCYTEVPLGAHYCPRCGLALRKA